MPVTAAGAADNHDSDESHHPGAVSDSAIRFDVSVVFTSFLWQSYATVGRRIAYVYIPNLLRKRSKSTIPISPSQLRSPEQAPRPSSHVSFPPSEPPNNTITCRALS